MYYWHAKTPKPREMQSNDDLQPFFGLIASTVERSQLERQILSQDNPCVDQSSSDEEKKS